MLVCLLGIFAASQGTAGRGQAARPVNPQTVAAQTPTAQPADDLTKPTFTVSALPSDRPIRVIAYGDMRFTDPENTSDTNPRVRKWLVERIAEEKPDILLLSGDLPFHGSDKEDWDVYKDETAPWRQAGLRVFTTLGNHELAMNQQTGLENYFANFPELNRHRWYSVRMGNIYLIALDSVGSFKPGTEQRKWIEAQLANLPKDVDFVFFLSHMPIRADVQSQMIVHLPAPEQSELRDYLEAQSSKTHAKFIVVNGHIHNYERYEHGGVTYLITGGGGAKPYPILVRGEEDLYKVEGFPNFHYLVITIDGRNGSGVMYRVTNPEATKLEVEKKDSFNLDAK